MHQLQVKMILTLIEITVGKEKSEKASMLFAAVFLFFFLLSAVSQTEYIFQKSI